MSSVQNFQCETIVFGKGIGESIIVRLSKNEWMIIDSCFNDIKNPAALDYLKERGVELSEVKLVVISHFHDDHIKGLSEIIEECQQAKIVISAALNTAEFRAYINALSSNGEEMAKTKEINKIMDFLPSLIEQQRLSFAKRDCILFRSVSGIEVRSLSPCDNDIAYSDLDFANSLKIAANTKEIVSSAKLVNPNHYCVVTRVSSPASGNNEILLGADLEVSKGAGWESVCDAIDSPKPNKIGLFKLPHHGSETGFHERTWIELIKEKPISVLTTYDRSSLPRKEMIDLYKERSSHIYCTSEPKSLKESGNNINKSDRSNVTSAVEKILSKMGSTVKFSNSVGKFGYVSINDCLTAEPKVTLSHAATAL
ncbi:hypothetical protein P805_04550 [Serratia marcescens BIDMC 44]|uniref:ComEC/Rec2 family competence protein n=1 Tax=Serratia marcescens TaxID=615 RepID=UPI000445F051|nr:MBL fold metallo-hydrolase [Serratia marcescens]ETX38687.1 hypothetical protein P805_04550 [Serratia marcescens BIDMC 44]